LGERHVEGECKQTHVHSKNGVEEIWNGLVTGKAIEATLKENSCRNYHIFEEDLVAKDCESDAKLRAVPEHQPS